MARIEPVDKTTVSPAVQLAFERHVETYKGRITNMKATLAHSLLAFNVYMQWYPLYEETRKILGDRLAYLFAYAVSYASNCPLCSTFFRKIIIDAGEQPEHLVLTTYEQEVLDVGEAIAANKGHINDELFQKLADKFSVYDIVVLVAFAGQMIATNVFNNVFETEIDGYLSGYIAPEQLSVHHE